MAIRNGSLKYEVGRAIDRHIQSAADEAARAERRGALRALQFAGLKPRQITSALGDIFGEKVDPNVTRARMSKSRSR